MQRKRARFVIEVDLDPVPGWGNDPADWQKLLESRMAESWYHPTVTFEGVVSPNEAKA